MSEHKKRSLSARACATGGVAALLMSSCTTPGMYDTSGYRECVYQMTATPDAVDVETQIGSLEAVVERARAADRRVAPGIHAHLGYLYSLRGDMDGTVAAFLAEKELYPESTVYIDGLLARMNHPQE